MSTCVLALGLLVQARIPTLCWGPPGIGKTAIIRAIAARLGLPCEVVIASLREPADFLGLPLPGEVQGRPVIRRAVEGWAARLQRGGGVLLLDEITCAAPAVQAALLRVVLERVVGEEQLSDAVAVVLAANPEDLAAGGWQLAAPLANRVVHLDWTTDPIAWCEAAIRGYPAPEVPALPESWRAQLGPARQLISAYIRRSPGALLAVPTDEAARSRAYPTPRSWDTAAQCLAACTAAQVAPEVRSAVVCGAVGHAAGGECLDYIDQLDLPDPEALLAAPASYRPDRRGDRASATLAALVAAVQPVPSRERWDVAWRIVQAHARLDRGLASHAASGLIQLLRAYGGQVDGQPPRDCAAWLAVLQPAVEAVMRAKQAGGGQ